MAGSGCAFRCQVRKTVYPKGCRVRGEVLSSNNLRVNGAGDSSGPPRGRQHLGLNPHQVLCVPKLPENLHDAITVDYSKESQSKGWQGNETGIAVLVSGDMKPGGWASRA